MPRLIVYALFRGEPERKECKSVRFPVTDWKRFETEGVISVQLQEDIKRVCREVFHLPHSPFPCYRSECKRRCTNVMQQSASNKKSITVAGYCGEKICARATFEALRQLEPNRKVEGFRSCHRCGKFANPIFPCPGCDTVTYCSLLCQALHIRKHVEECTDADFLRAGLGSVLDEFKEEKKETVSKSVQEPLSTAAAVPPTSTTPKVVSSIRKANKCGNPSCSKMESGEEKFKRCSRCKSCFYCSTECQTSHWSTHKSTCTAPVPS